MDAFDRKILKSLQEDGRLTNGELAERVNLSPSQCSRRRIELEKSGLIAGYHAQIDRKKTGLGVTSLISVSLWHHDETNADDLRAMLQSNPNVLSAFALTGEMDYMITVVAGDLDELSAFINQTLLPHRAVQNVKSSIVLETIKNSSSLPL